MTKRLVLVAGNIGTGKTSLTERLGACLGWRTAFESVADNPYLADFYFFWATAPGNTWSWLTAPSRPSPTAASTKTPTSLPGPCTTWAI